MKKLIAIGVLALLITGAAEANPFYKNRKHVYDKKNTSGSKIFYQQEPSYNPTYVYHNIRTEHRQKPGLVNVKLTKKQSGPMAKNSVKGEQLKKLELPALLVLFNLR